MAYGEGGCGVDGCDGGERIDGCESKGGDGVRCGVGGVDAGKKEEEGGGYGWVMEERC